MNNIITQIKAVYKFYNFFESKDKKRYIYMF